MNWLSEEVEEKIKDDMMQEKTNSKLKHEKIIKIKE